MIKCSLHPWERCLSCSGFFVFCFCGEEGWFGQLTRNVGFCLADHEWNLGPQQGELDILTASLHTCQVSQS